MPSPRDKRKHKKAVARKKKQKKSGVSRSAVVAQIAEWAATVAEWPLRLCIASPWLEKRKQGVILVARDTPDGRVAGVLFLFDLGYMGLRGAAPIGPESPELFEKRLSEMSLSAAANRMELPVAMAILLRAIEGAERWGLPPRPDYAAFLPIVGDAVADDDAALPSFGWDGKPLYIEWEDDNAERVVNTLEERFGPRGFHHAGLDGAIRLGLAPTDVSEADLPARVARCAELASALELLARYGPFDEERALYSVRARMYEGDDLPEFELTDVELQNFIRGDVFEGGVSVLDFFLDQDGLTEWDIRTLEGWRETHPGVFRVVEQQDDHTVLESLATEFRYVVRPMTQKQWLPSMQVGTLLPAHLVRFEDHWLIADNSGELEDESHAEEVAAAMAYLHPVVVFDDPALLDAGWQLQREQGEDFEAFFGSRVVKIMGAELKPKIESWMHYRHEKLEERVAAGGHLEAGLVDPGEPDLPDDILDDEEVFVLFGDRWGINFVSFFDELEALFENPSWMEDKERRAVLNDYVELDSITPLPFEILAQKHPEGASAVFAAYRKQPDFDWAKDGEDLLRLLKPGYFENLLPQTRPLSKKMIEALRRAKKRGLTP